MDYLKTLKPKLEKRFKLVHSAISDDDVEAEFAEDEE